MLPLPLAINCRRQLPANGRQLVAVYILELIALGKIQRLIPRAFRQSIIALFLADPGRYLPCSVLLCRQCPGAVRTCEA